MTIQSRKDNNFMNEGMDLRRFFLCLTRKLWLVIIVIIMGGAIGAGAYKAYYAVTDGETQYKIRTDYRIIFNEKDHPNGMDYFNAYTWNQFVTDDKIVDYALANAEAITREDIKNSVSARMLSDYRILTVEVTGTNKDKLNVINEVYKLAMPNFADSVPELTSIEVWSCDDMVINNIHNKTLNAAVLGMIIALVLAGFVISLVYCLDDRIYVEPDLQKLGIDVPCFGYDCAGFAEDTQRNKEKIIGKASAVEYKDGMKPEEVKDNEGVVLVIPWGKKHATAIKYDIDQLAKQDIKVFGTVITDCNEKYLKAYYGFGKK